jgi:large subunit ribosomal protein L23
MLKKSPYDIIQCRYLTEKSKVLQELQSNTSNPSVRRCQSPKYVFLVDTRANKQEIAEAIEEIYAAKNVRVVAVNTLTMKPKPRRVRGRSGWTSAFKKAIIALEPGDRLEELV